MLMLFVFEIYTCICHIYIYTISYVHAIFLHHKFKVNLQVEFFTEVVSKLNVWLTLGKNGLKNGCRLVLKVCPEIVQSTLIIDR